MTDDKQKPDGWRYLNFVFFVSDYEEDCGYSGSSPAINPESILKEKVLKCLFVREFKVHYHADNPLYTTAMAVLKERYYHLIRPFKLVYLDKENDNDN